MSGQDHDSAAAGDVAPRIVWDKVLQPEDGQPSGLFGSITVIHFFPNLAGNEWLMDEWNALVTDFASQPVNFLWITPEKASAVQPLLKKHGFEGWLLLDAKSENAKAYGIESMGTALVDSSGKIAGFTHMLPSVNQIQAVRDGKTADTVGIRSFPPFRLASSLGRPDFPPSYEVKISPTKTEGTDSSSGPDFLIEKGFDLRTMISRVYGKEPSRIVLPPDLDGSDTRYDFVLVLPAPEEQQSMYRMVQAAIEKKFGLMKAVEQRSVDVYVMTAVPGKLKPAKAGQYGSSGGVFCFFNSEWVMPREHGGQPPTASESSKLTQIATLSAITAMGGNLTEVRTFLEEGLHRPIVNETGLEGGVGISKVVIISRFSFSISTI